MAETKAEAEKAFDFFIEAYGAKYDKATERLIKDRERLLTFYDFPAEHWKHIRTTNPIESTFATVRHRTVKTKGCLSRKTALAMAFKLIKLSCAQRKIGGSWTTQIRSPKLSKECRSRAGSNKLNTPPETPVTNF